MNQQRTARSKTLAQEPPPPGTREARALGCTCPLAHDPENRDAGLVIYFGHCPVHKPVVDRMLRRRAAAEASPADAGPNPGNLAS